MDNVAVLDDWISRSEALQRLFSTFPRGWPGMGLLMLRAAVGIVLLGDAAVALSADAAATPSAVAVSVLRFASGLCLLLGFMTPVAGGLAALSSIAVTVSSAALIAVVAASLSLLGPGAFSVDSHLFGRREIVIPQSPRPSKK